MVYQFLFIQELNDDVASSRNSYHPLLRVYTEFISVHSQRSILRSTIFGIIAIIVPAVCHPERSEGSDWLY
jgi:hypothetical protein